MIVDTYNTSAQMIAAVNQSATYLLTATNVVNANTSAQMITAVNNTGISITGNAATVTTAPYQNSAAGWVNNSVDINTSMNGVNVTIDSGALKVDASNNRVGVNTSQPNSTLQVIGNASISTTLNVVGAISSATSVALTGATNNVGTITTGTWSGTAISAAKGGTGQTTGAVGDLFYVSAVAPTVSKLAIGAAGTVLTSSGTLPQWSTGYSTLAATTTSIGNWSGNQSSYATITNLNSVGNWSADKVGVCLANGTQCQLSIPNLTATGGASAGSVAEWSNGTNLGYSTILSDTGSQILVNGVLNVTNNLSVTGSTFVVNSTNVGIGTQSPNYTLHVVGTLDTDGAMYTNGVRNLMMQDYYCPFTAIQAVTMCYPNYFGVAKNSGTSTNVAGTRNHPGTVSISSAAASANSGYIYTSYASAFLINGSERYAISFSPQTVQAANQTWTEAGFIDTVTVGTDATDGVYFKIVNLTVYGQVANNSRLANTSSTYTLAAGSWYVGILNVSADASKVTYTIYNDTSGAVLWQDNLTTSLPTATGRETGAGIVSGRTTAGSANTVIYVDYMDASIPTFRKVT